MNKKELIDAISASADISKDAAGRTIDALVSTISSELAAGKEVSLVGFGTFSVKKRSERSGRNPSTGEPLTIAASTVPGFKPGKGLKDAVNS